MFHMEARQLGWDVKVDRDRDRLLEHRLDVGEQACGLRKAVKDRAFGCDPDRMAQQL
jgi:hypothetical protein